MDDHYLQYQDLIRKAVWKRLASSPWINDKEEMFNELMSEGNLAYAEALKTWDPDKGAFSTHLTWRLRHRLGRSYGKAVEHDNATAPLDGAKEIPGLNNPLESGSFTAALEGLGAEAMEVVRVILGSAGELCDFTLGTVKATRGGIREYLRGRHWPGRKIDSAMAEIRDMLRSM